MPKFTHCFFITLCYLGGASAFGASDAGTSSSDLDTALDTENVNGGVVNFGSGNVILTDQVRAVQSDGTFTFVSPANIIINRSNASQVVLQIPLIFP